MVNNNRKGLIKVSNELYEKEYDTISLIFKDFRPTYIEFRHWDNNTWYIYGVSEFFEEVSEGSAIRQYEVVFTSHQNEGDFSVYYTYEFRKIEF